MVEKAVHLVPAGKQKGRWKLLGSQYPLQAHPTSPKRPNFLLLGPPSKGSTTSQYATVWEQVFNTWFFWGCSRSKLYQFVACSFCLNVSEHFKIFILHIFCHPFFNCEFNDFFGQQIQVFVLGKKFCYLLLVI